jgi:predicted transcriptional regulator
MNTNINIRLKPTLLRQLEQKKKTLNLDTEAVISKALEDYFYFDRINALREEMKFKATELGFVTEEDIFNAIS